MTINKAIRTAMHNKGVTLSTMGKSLRKKDRKSGELIELKANDVSARLNTANMTFDSAVEMLNILGYEIVIQERKPGSRRADQVVVDQISEVD